LFRSPDPQGSQDQQQREDRDHKTTVPEPNGASLVTFFRGKSLR